MKRNHRFAVVIAAAVLLSLALSGCGLRSEAVVDVGNRTITASISILYTKAELDENADLSAFHTEQYRGETYYVSNDDPTKSKVTKSKLAKNFYVLDSNKFIFYLDNSECDYSSYKDMYEMMDFADYKATFTKKPLTSSGKISGKTVSWKKYKGTKLMYVTFTKKAAKCKTVKASIKTGKTTSKSKVQFTSPGVITKITVNGKTYHPKVTYSKKKLQRDYVKFTKAGTYKIKVTLSSGYTKTFKYKYSK